MPLIKIIINDKIIFLINFIILVLIDTYILQIDICSGNRLLLFVILMGGFSYFISTFTTIIILILIHSKLKNRIQFCDNTLSFSKKLFLIANTLEVYDDKIHTVNDLIFYLYENQANNFIKFLKF